jgi:hypothetical protein
MPSETQTSYFQQVKIQPANQKELKRAGEAVGKMLYFLI